MVFALLVASAFFLWAQINPESMIGAFSSDAGVIAAGVPYFRSCSYDYLMVALVFTLNGYLNGRSKTVWTMVSCSAGALLLRIPLVYLFAGRFGDQLGMLGLVAPIVSGIMACYTLIYVLWEGRHSRKKEKTA